MIGELKRKKSVKSHTGNNSSNTWRISVPPRIRLSITGLRRGRDSRVPLTVGRANVVLL